MTCWPISYCYSEMLITPALCSLDSSGKRKENIATGNCKRKKSTNSAMYNSLVTIAINFFCTGYLTQEARPKATTASIPHRGGSIGHRAAPLPAIASPLLPSDLRHTAALLPPVSLFPLILLSTEMVDFSPAPPSLVPPSTRAVCDPQKPPAHDTLPLPIGVPSPLLSPAVGFIDMAPDEETGASASLSTTFVFAAASTPLSTTRPTPRSRLSHRRPTPPWPPRPTAVPTSGRTQLPYRRPTPSPSSPSVPNQHVIDISEIEEDKQ